MGHCAFKSTYEDSMHEDSTYKLSTDYSAAEQFLAAQKVSRIVVSSPGTVTSTKRK